jgi:deoxyadenosine/deoxycytidine kinase
LPNNFCQIAIAGNIGAGKTTLTKKLSKDLNINPIFESVDDNPYLEKFYSDMNRWSFNLQIFFLHKRFSNQLELINSKQSFVQDRSIYEDKEIFAKNLNDMKLMSDVDWETYCNLFKDMIQFIDQPDLIIYLKASTSTLISRIKNRKRDFEVDISPEYIHSLNIYYDKWISKINKDKVLVVDSDNFNIFKDSDKYLDIKKSILKKVPILC